MTADPVLTDEEARRLAFAPTYVKMLLRERHRRWEAVHRELKRRHRMLERIRDKAIKSFSARSTLFHARLDCWTEEYSGDMPRPLVEQLPELAPEDNREHLLQINEAIERIAQQLREHELAIPSLRDDPLELLSRAPPVIRRLPRARTTTAELG